MLRRKFIELVSLVVGSLPFLGCTLPEGLPEIDVELDWDPIYFTNAIVVGHDLFVRLVEHPAFISYEPTINEEPYIIFKCGKCALSASTVHNGPRCEHPTEIKFANALTMLFEGFKTHFVGVLGGRWRVFYAEDSDPEYFWVSYCGDPECRAYFKAVIEQRRKDRNDPSYYASPDGKWLCTMSECRPWQFICVSAPPGIFTEKHFPGPFGQTT